MNRKIKFNSKRWYSVDELKALVDALEQQQTTDCNSEGKYALTVGDGTMYVTYKIDKEGDITVYDKKD